MTSFFRALRDFFGLRFRRASGKRLELEKGFLEAERDLFVERFAQASNFALAVVAVMSFAAVDYYLTPELFANFLAARLLVVPFSVLCWGAYQLRPFRGRWHFVPAYVS